jgi:hypothetical protein
VEPRAASFRSRWRQVQQQEPARDGIEYILRDLGDDEARQIGIEPCHEAGGDDPDDV